MRLTYLKQHRRKLYQELVSTGKLQAHLLDINDTANDWLDRIMPQMAKAAGATEELKSRDQMAWVGLMNITYEKKARKAGAGVVKWRVWNTST